jgi:hypothetical protein
LKEWTSDDNYTAIGYMKFAMEHYNKRVANAKETGYSEDDYFGLPELTEQQQQRMVGAMHRSFDTHTEQEAFDKA